MKSLLLVFTAIFLDVMACGSRHEPDYLDVSTKAIALENRQGASATFKVASNSQWTITTGECSWLEVNPLSGNGNAQIELSAQSANESTYSRSCTLIIHGVDVELEVSVDQMGGFSIDK